MIPCSAVPALPGRGWTHLLGIRVCSFRLVFSLRHDKVMVPCGAAPSNQGEGRAPGGERAGSGRSDARVPPFRRTFPPRLGSAHTRSSSSCVPWDQHPCVSVRRKHCRMLLSQPGVTILPLGKKIYIIYKTQGWGESYNKPPER